MSGNSGAWGIAMWKDGHDFPQQEQGISLSGGHAVDAHLPTAPLGFLTLPPDGLGVPPVRNGDVAFAQRDGVVQFADYYEARQITLQVDVPNEGCPGCGPVVNDTFLSLTGLPGRSVTTEAPVVSPTEDIEIRVDLAMDNWASGNIEAFIGQWGDSGDRSYLFRVQNSGLLQFFWSPDGDVNFNEVSSVALPYAPGERATVRVTRVAATGVTTFSTGPSIDGPFTQFGLARDSDPSSIHAETDFPLEVGSRGDGVLDPLMGRVYEARVYSGIGGDLVASPDFGDQGVGTVQFQDDQGNLWRILDSAVIGSAPASPAPMSARQRVARLTQEWSRNCSGATLVIFTDCHDPDATEEEKVWLGPYLMHGRPRVAEVTWRRSDIGGASVLLRFDAADARLLLAETNPGGGWSGQKSIFFDPNENLAPDPDLSEQTMTTNGATVQDNHLSTGGPSGPDGGPWFSRLVITPNTTSPFAMATGGSGTAGIPVVAGQPYSFAWWAMKDPSGGQATRADWTWYDAAGAVINANNGAGQSATATWQRFTQENAIAPVGAAFLQVRLIWTGTAIAGQTLGFAQLWINQGATSTAPETMEVVGTLCVYPLIHLDSTMTAPIVVTYGNHEFTYNEDITSGRITVDTRYGRATDFTIDQTQHLSGDYSSPLEPGVHDVQVRTANPADTGTVSVEWANAVVSG